MARPELTLKPRPARRPVFVPQRTESAVAAGVTILVAGWFLVAGGVILADPASPYTTRTVHVHTFPPIEVVGSASALEPKVVAPVASSDAQKRSQRTALAAEPVGIVPDARFLITVEARRG